MEQQAAGPKGVRLALLSVMHGLRQIHFLAQAL
jgi:hypothetical protein